MRKDLRGKKNINKKIVVMILINLENVLIIYLKSHDSKNLIYK